MKTKTISALDEALADMGGMVPKHPDEFTNADMRAKVGGSVSYSAMMRRLNALVESGTYTKRNLKGEWLFRKIDTSAKTR